MTTFNDLLKLNNLGNRQSLLFFLFDGLPNSSSYSLQGFRSYCINSYFPLAYCFDALLSLFQFIGFIIIQNGSVGLNKGHFDPARYSKSDYLKNYHFYGSLFKALQKDNVMQEIFNMNCLKQEPHECRYFLLDNQISNRFLPIRNLLLTLGFLERDDLIPNHLIIQRRYVTDFEAQITHAKRANNFKHRLTLDDLKRRIASQELVGHEAEIWVMEYEYKRLQRHPSVENIRIISDQQANAGYDIESYENINSIWNDRFIEVKSYTGQPTFFWSRNEVESSRELGKRYFIYLVNREAFENLDYRPMIIQDPYNHVYLSDMWNKDAITWKVSLQN